ncbi:SpoIIE family protein phosphatase [Calidifontibacillus erzurumensis]|uniref:SpoIIE family protein phosphatase n=1 Tax=Calidifontibacillus erzurumensis TaxID=2741433 RepID=A0A8J8K896_9BACI|nr:PP2C family protein-serine/threonine phosphatase [Calidifontibacillus erzurumensis]NSL51666.1 SpoIIE family protein phosphatase [Calidifontibacillus erzurumensis]
MSNLPHSLEQQLQLAANVFTYSIEGIFVTDLNGCIQIVNRSFEKITGYSAQEAVGQNPRILKSGKHPLSFYQAIWKSLEQKGEWQGEFINRRKNGELYYQRTTIATIKDAYGVPTSYCAIFSDVTKMKEAERKLAADLALARQLQKSVLSKPIQNELVHIDGVYIPSAELAGDMYAWYEINEHQYGVILFDMVGHGVASSLVSMSIRSLLRGIITTMKKPKPVFTELNEHMRLLYRNNGTDHSYFFTAIYLFIDVKERVIEYASAGHPPSFFIQKDGQVRYLDVGCPPVGLLPDLNIETEVIPFQGRTQLFLYTDGIMDSLGKNTRENIERLENLVKSLREKDSTQLLESVLRHVSNGEHLFDDDVTMVAITMNG